MKLTDWLDADRGRLTALAAHFALSPSAVSQWRAEGVPVRRMRAVRDFTAGEVTLDEMVAHREAAANGTEAQRAAGLQGGSTKGRR